MNRAKALPIALSITFMAGNSAKADIITNGSFETPSLSTTQPRYCYVVPLPSLPVCKEQGVEVQFGKFGVWQGTGGAAISMINTPWGQNGHAADGVQFAVLQGISSWSQSFSINSSATFVISWWDAGRSREGWSGNQDYIVTIDGKEIGSFSTVSNQSFTPRSLNVYLERGTHTLGFVSGIGDTKFIDRTAYIDHISISARRSGSR